ncbi:lactonase family protein [Lacisediminihabitans sp.]|uniref:lactonase family protein n=1 Tax=Lacisediminihabitans sp. TaxID=2787631 RepID=UPI00374D8EBA
MRPVTHWIGSYTASMGGDALGIGAAATREDGTLEFLGLAAETSSPSFLANGVVPGIVYSTDEGSGRVEAFRRVDEFGLAALGGRAVSGGSPCHLSVTASRLYVSNYGDGSVDVFPLDAEGRIGELAQTLQGSGSGPTEDQGGPHAHATHVVGPTVLSADLGADRVHVHRVRGGTLERIGTGVFPPGTGPRDFADSSGELYLLGELDGGVYRIDEAARTIASGRVVADWVTGDHAAAIAIDEHGTFAYVGLRGSNRVAVLMIDDLSPVAAVPTGGSWPRHLVRDGGVLHVANQLSSTVTSFRLEPHTGIPRPLGRPESVPSPTYLLPVG